MDDDFPGPDAEAALMEVALDDLPVEVALRERAGPVRARVVGHVKASVHVEDGQTQVVGFDFEGLAGADLVGGAA